MSFSHTLGLLYILRRYSHLKDILSYLDKSIWCIRRLPPWSGLLSNFLSLSSRGVLILKFLWYSGIWFINLVSDEDGSRVWLLKTSHLGIFATKLFWWRLGIWNLVWEVKHIEETSVQISDLVLLYILRYTLFKLGFVTSPNPVSNRCFR